MAEIEIDDDFEVLWIESGRALDGGPIQCRLTWRDEQWAAPVRCVLGVAADLFTAAAYADLVGQVFGMGLAGDQVEELMLRMLGPTIRARTHTYEGRMLGCGDVFGLAPGGSSSARVGVVILQRGDRRSYVDADEARELGGSFFSAAGASVSDTLFDAVARQAGLLGDEELALFFELAMAARGGGGQGH